MAFNRVWRDRETRLVILDSSAILMLFEFSINLEDELTRLIGKFKILIPQTIYNEIEEISKKGNQRKKFNAKAALELIKKYEIIDANGLGDESVLSLAKKLNCFVVTNDKDLRIRLKENHLKVLFLRSKKKLEIE
jgi:rRNA-processing protein FCF1